MAWLTFDDLCSEMQLRPSQVRRLIKQGKLVGVCHGRKSRLETDWRFVDPSDKYKRALATLEKLHARTYTADLGSVPILSTSDFAAMCGITQNRVHGLIHRKVLRPHKEGKFSFFTPNQLRAYLLRREGREFGPSRARMTNVLDWCRRYVAEGRARSLTRQQVRQDDALEGTLQRILRLREPERSKAVKEFWRRYQVAADFVKASQS